MAGTNPVLIAAVVQAGRCLAESRAVVGNAPAAAILALLQLVPGGRTDTRPADRERAIVVRRRNRQRRHASGRIRHHCGLDGRESGTAPFVAGPHAIVVTPVAQTRHRLAQRRAVLRNTPTTSVLARSEEHTSELQSLMSISYAAF